MLKNNDFNVGFFKYFKSKKILEINLYNLVVRYINDNELEKLRVKYRDFKVILFCIKNEFVFYKK